MALSRMTADRPILTFNHDESFLCALAGVGARFDVVIRHGSTDLTWNQRARQVPRNFKLVEFDWAVKNIRAAAYQQAICHKIRNLFWLLPYQRRRIVFIEHAPLFKSYTFLPINMLRRLILLTWRLLFGLKVIATSEINRISWGVKASVIRPYAVPLPAEFLAPYKDPLVHAIAVGDFIKESGEEWGILESLMPNAPIRIIGYNPKIPGSYYPPNFPEYVNAVSKAHVYIYAVPPAHGDGYDIPMLEAMQIGLPVVTMLNLNSPIIHGRNGLVAKNAAEMLGHIKTLIADPELRERLGRAARETVQNDKRAETFWNNWNKILGISGVQEQSSITEIS